MTPKFQTQKTKTSNTFFPIVIVLIFVFQDKVSILELAL